MEETLEGFLFQDWKTHNRCCLETRKQFMAWTEDVGNGMSHKGLLFHESFLIPLTSSILSHQLKKWEWP